MRYPYINEDNMGVNRIFSVLGKTPNVNNLLFAFLRAVYFPISCSDYFRYLSKDYKK